ncbi:MAG: 30S ribosome-binding factor RbfA [SAR324 cluster bacterium]|jgi:ribosome-binding factor A|nr:30S ribosome-binding factor RbfA [SAR324 cluster bacterium]MDP6743401.1 30S ribosome-binding factor RbfA [SAR324 cluster bacterium]MDP7046011.1 30S ribosome-binding factor RbfA [SAR324 cluster bacterium]MEC9460222.1 30S ribosome-binding factor RbfA [SAR324 cluster bacterium]MED5482384.1 30S ribosome-binding factor RbfA [SAR324 cluster bacterium]
MKKTGRSSFSTLVQRRLSEILLFESKDPRFKRVTISRVEAAPNMSSAKVHVTIFPSTGQQKLVDSLNNAAGYFSIQLGKVLKTRNTPQLTFVYDAGFDHSDEIEMLLRSVLPKVSDQSQESDLDLNVETAE